MNDLDRLPRGMRRVIKATARAAFAKGAAQERAKFDAMLSRYHQLKELNGTGELFAKAWQESQHKRDHGQFSATGGGPASAPTEEHPADTHSRSMLARLKDVPPALVARVSAYIEKKYADMAERYGPTGAKAVLAAAVLLTPVPLPGTTLIPVALAEAVRKIVGVFRKSSVGEPLADDRIHELALELIHDIHAAGLEDDEPEAVEKAWDESAHPRDDVGKFVGAGELSDARRDPAKAESLRAKVTNPDERAKLDKALAAKGHSPDSRQGSVLRNEFHYEAGQTLVARYHRELVKLTGEYRDGTHTTDAMVVAVDDATAKHAARMSNHYRDAYQKAKVVASEDVGPAALESREWVAVGEAFQDAIRDAKKDAEHVGGMLTSHLNDYGRKTVYSADPTTGERITAEEDDPEHRKWFMRRQESDVADKLPAYLQDVSSSQTDYQHAIWDALEAFLDAHKSGWRQAGGQLTRLFKSKDASGHEHKESGPGGGQFTAGSGGGGGEGEDARPQLSRLPENEDEAIALATAARNAIIGEDDGDCAVDGDCDRASWIIRAAHPDIEIWHGEYNGEIGHNILKAGEWFIDITADQFGAEPIRVWHESEHEKGVTGEYGEYSGFYRSKSNEGRADTMGLSAAATLHELKEYVHGPALLPQKLQKSKDASGHEHKESGPGGGQFTAGGGGGGEEKPAKKKPGGKKAASRVKEKPISEKAARAKANHVLVGADVQRYAEEHNEPRFAKAMGGVSFPDGEPVDVAVPGKDGKVAHGVELKTMTVGKDNKLTMNAYAQVRKLNWEREQGAAFHTVVSDDRKIFGQKKPDDSKRVYYYRRGIAGSARIGSLHKVEGGEDELKKLMAMPEDQLPDAAKRAEKDWLTAGKWVALKGERGYRNTKTGQEVRPKK